MEGRTMDNISKTRAAAAGLAGGILNGMFGSGGGAAVVPMLRAKGTDAAKIHAFSVAVMFFISIVSAVGNAILGMVPADMAKRLIPAGIIGAVTGSLLLRKIDNDVLRRIFGVLLIYSGGRVLIQWTG